MSKWADEFKEMYPTIGELKRRTKKWRKINKKEAEKIDKIYSRFK